MHNFFFAFLALQPLRYLPQEIKAIVFAGFILGISKMSAASFTRSICSSSSWNLDSHRTLVSFHHGSITFHSFSHLSFLLKNKMTMFQCFSYQTQEKDVNTCCTFDESGKTLQREEHQKHTAKSNDTTRLYKKAALLKGKLSN